MIQNVYRQLTYLVSKPPTDGPRYPEKAATPLINPPMYGSISALPISIMMRIHREYKAEAPIPLKCAKYDQLGQRSRKTSSQGEGRKEDERKEEGFTPSEKISEVGRNDCKTFRSSSDKDLAIFPTTNHEVQLHYWPE